ncbi:hypothetical protein BDW71DRAFT_1036 [Aspergillus fruticulosus]
MMWWRYALCAVSPYLSNLKEANKPAKKSRRGMKHLITRTTARTDQFGSQWSFFFVPFRSRAPALSWGCLYFLSLLSERSVREMDCIWRRIGSLSGHGFFGQSLSCFAMYTRYGVRCADNNFALLIYEETPQSSL